MKRELLIRLLPLCMVCAIPCAGCGAVENDKIEEIEAGKETESTSAVPALPEWNLGEWSGDEEQGEPENLVLEGILAEKTGIEKPGIISAFIGLIIETEETEIMKTVQYAVQRSGVEKAGAENGNAYGQDAESDIPLLEQLFTYEKDRRYSYRDDSYVTITGIAWEYDGNDRQNFWKYMEEIRDNYGSKQVMLLPSDIDGMPVKEIAPGAFADVQMYGVIFPDTVERIGEGAFQNSGLYEVEFSENLEYIGAQAFENCNLTRVAFPDKPVLIEERAFAENQGLWTVLIPDVETRLENRAFEGCAPQFLLCYGAGQEEKRNTVLPYAEENGMETMAVIASKRPVVNYHDAPLVLKPEVRNFFYGDDGDEEKDQWCTWEENVNAPNFGYSDWQWSGCSSWCGCIDFELSTRASSELASGDDRYAADNVLWQNRYAAWAEGVEGPGIGESITYYQSYTSAVDNPWEEMTWENREPVQNGLYGYTEICIVNGYAKDEKTWEENGRIKRLAMYVEGELYAYLELEDTMFPQYFLLPEGDIIVPNRTMLEACFVIEDVYEGSLYEDTCLTGLVMEFSGRYAH